MSEWGEIIVGILNHLSPAYVGVCMLIFAYGSLWVLDYIWGALGVCVYTIIVALVANIQVLKWVKFIFLPHPIAMGTAIFSTLFLASDLLVEKYGLSWAKRSIALTFVAQGVFAVLMFLTMGMQGHEATAHVQEAFSIVFMPSLKLWVAGLIAFFVSQLLDVSLYQWIKDFFKGRFLWLRAGVAYALAALCDNIIFSMLAWRLLANEPIEWSILWQTYILGGYGLRLVFGGLNIGLLYLYTKRSLLSEQ